MSTATPVLLPEHAQAVKERANTVMMLANAAGRYAGFSWQNEVNALMAAGLLVTPAHTAALELAAALRAYQQKHCAAGSLNFKLIVVDNPEYRAIMDAFQKVRPLVQSPNRFQVFYAGNTLTATLPWAVLDSNHNAAIAYFRTELAAQDYASSRNKA